MADKTVKGRFVWHELMTPDATAAHSFYTGTVGWKSQSWEHNPAYNMFAAVSGPVGGTAALESGSPPCWLPYIGTTDIDATVRKAKELGAKVAKEVTDLPDGGKYAVFTDPQGASFGVVWSVAPPSAEKAPQRGEFSWHELATTDYKGAFHFYSHLFGWEPAGEHDMGPSGIYFMFGRNGTPLGGIFNKFPEMPGGPSWLSYVRVKDVNQAVKKVTAAGGKLLNGPMEVPGGDWIATFTDAQGAGFAVHALQADVQPAKPAVSEASAESQPAEAPAKPTAKARTKTQARTKAKAKPRAAAKVAKKNAGSKGAKAASKSATKKKVAKKKSTASKKAGARKKGGKKKVAARNARRPAAKTKAVRRAGRKTQGRAAGKKKAARKAK